MTPRYGHVSGKDAIANSGDYGRARLRLVVLGLLIGAGDAGALLVVATNGHVVASQFGSGVLDWLALVAVGFMLIVVLFPYPILAAACGYRFGTLVGTAVVLLSLILGAAVSCLLARWAGSGAGAAALGGRMARLARRLELRGFRAVLLARVVGLPFALVSYSSGLTRLSVAAVALATGVGIAPRAFAYTALGGSLHALDRPEGGVFLGLSALLVLATIVVSMALRRTVKNQVPLDQRDPAVGSDEDK